MLLLREAMNFVKANTCYGWEKLPDGPKSPTQKYRLTEAGRKVMEE